MLCDVSLLRRVSWFRLSKAFLRSMNTAIRGVLSLRFKARSTSSMASAIEVDLFLRNPYCCLVGGCFPCMCRVGRGLRLQGSCLGSGRER